jgi:hypothetical protein
VIKNVIFWPKEFLFHVFLWHLQVYIQCNLSYEHVHIVRIISQDVTIAENMKNILFFTLLFQNSLVIELVTLKMGLHNIYVHAHMLNYIECKPVRVKEKHEIKILLVKKLRFWSQNINMKNSLVWFGLWCLAPLSTE